MLRFFFPIQSCALVRQVECPSVTPEVVLKASGHVDRFTDFMVTDVVTHDCHRADHLLEAALEAKLGSKEPPSAGEREARPCSVVVARECHPDQRMSGRGNGAHGSPATGCA